MSARQAADPKIRATEGVVSDEQWRPLHPVSPVINVWKGLTILLAIILFQNTNLLMNALSSDVARSLGIAAVFGIVLAVLLVFVLIVGLYSYFAWRVTRFAITDNGVYYRSGILLRTLKQARLERIQGVDIQHPLLGRIFGLGKIDIEVAGGAGSKVAFGFLKTEELEDIRAEILARASGAFSDSMIAEGGADALNAAAPSAAPAAGTAPAGAPIPAAGALASAGRRIDPRAGAPGSGAAAGGRASARRFAPVAPERVLYTVPVGRLIGSLLLNGGVVFGLVFLLAVIIGVIVLIAAVGLEGLSGMFGILPVLAIVASLMWSRFAGEFNFTAAVSPDGIRTRSGLLETRSQTIPPNRIHAVRIQRPWLWRRVGWYRVTITQAGFAGQAQQEGQQVASADVLLPVGTRADAELALWLVVRDLGVPDPLAFINSALDGKGEAAGFIPVGRGARLIDPLVKKRRAAALTGTCLFIRDGWLSWDLSVIPIERLQSVKISQGPLERRLRLVDVEAQLVPGHTPYRVHHLEESAGAALMEGLRERALIRRAKEAPERWLSRVQSRLDVEGRTDTIGEGGAVVASQPGPGAPVPAAPAPAPAVPEFGAPAPMPGARMPGAAMPGAPLPGAPASPVQASESTAPEAPRAPEDRA